MTISGGRTKQLDIFYRVTGFTSDFLNFIGMELIWLQLFAVDEMCVVCVSLAVADQADT